MGKYKYIFFDLDCTLWDYDNNAAKALDTIFITHNLEHYFENASIFISLFLKYNELLWNEFREGRISKDVLRIKRFDMCFNEVGREEKALSEKLNAEFLELSPKSAGLMPGAIEVLNYLKDKKYRLFIITNGFTRIQKLKLKYSGLDVFFERMFTSENVGSNKPKRKMFEYSIKSANAIKKASLMVGDDLKIDILGAKNFGLDQVYYNPARNMHSEKVTYEIRDLLELKGIL